MNTFMVHIYPSNMPTSEAIVAWTERRLGAALRRFAGRITRIDVHFADLNGPKEGKADIRCAFEVRVNGRRPVVVEHRAESLYDAIDGASKKVRIAVGRAVDRVITRRQRRARRASAGWRGSARRGSGVMYGG